MFLINKMLIKRVAVCFFVFLFSDAPVISSPLLQFGNDIHRIYKSHFDSGEHFLSRGNYHQAVQEFRKSLSLAEEYDFREGIVLCSTRLGLLYWNIGELEESAQFYRKALSLAERNGFESFAEECQKLLDIYMLYLEGKEFRASGDYQEAIRRFQRAVDLSKEIGSEAHQLKCLRQMSICYLDTSELDEFLRLNKISLLLARKLNHLIEESRCLNNIGIYHWKLNEYAKAIASYMDSFLLAKKTKNRIVESACINNIGLLYKTIGDYGKAIEFFKKALTIDKHFGNKKAISIDLNNIGGAYFRRAVILKRKQDYQKARQFFQECLNIADEIGNKSVEVRVLNNIGIIYLSLNMNAEGYSYFSIALQKAQSIKDLEALGMINCNIGIYYQSISDFKRAEIFFQKSENICKKIKASHILWEVYFGLGQCCEILEKKDEAIKFYKKSIKEIDSIRSRILLDTLKAGFVKDKLNVYECLLNLLYKEKKKSLDKVGSAEIFNVVEKAKARAFLEVLGESQFSLKHGLDDVLKNKDKDYALEISKGLNIFANARPTKEEIQKMKREYKQAEYEYVLLNSKMRSELPEITKKVPQPYSLLQIQQFLLTRNTALIEYYLGEKRSFLFLIQKNNFHIFLLPSGKDIQKSIRGYLKEISDPPQGKYRGYLAGKRLYREFFSPVAKILPDSIDHLIIVPDGSLYYLPFESLIIDSPNKSVNDRYLIEKYKISYAPSSSSLLFLKENRKNKKFPRILLAMGNPNYNKVPKSKIENKFLSTIMKELYENQGFEFSPLPHSEREIKEISKYFPKEKQNIFLDDQATEEVIKKTSLENYQIIHFACHSLLDERFPFRSALVLAADKNYEEDGFLLVREIYNLRLAAEMIVLSACQTGRGRLEDIEGVLGLPRIFFYCGARSVVSSLWNVNDKSSTKFMSHFYEFLSQGMSKSQALRMAKMEMLKSRYSHPFYWASFILYGDEIPLQNLN